MAVPAREPRPYIAFISYRHRPLDRWWAEWLHTRLETFRVPRRLVAERALPERLGRVFRDEDEMPAGAHLTDQIREALRASGALIVVCTKATPGSEWIEREVREFRKLGRGARIFALLVEGEPHEAFPTALVEIRHAVVDGAGKSGEEIERIEPLAADVRPRRGARSGWLRHMALLRIVAALLPCDFDDLRRRDDERRTRSRRWRIAWIGVLAAVLVGAAVWALRERGRADSEAAATRRSTASRFVAEARRELEVDASDRALVLLSAAYSLGDVSEATRMLLARAARPMDAVLCRVRRGGITCGDLRPDGLRFATGGGGRLTMWDVETGLPLREGTGSAGIHRVQFSADGRRLLTWGNESVSVWDAEDGRQMAVLSVKPTDVVAAAISRDGTRVMTADDASRVVVWDVEGPRIRAKLPGERQQNVRSAAMSRDGALVAAAATDMTVRIWDAAQGTLMRELQGVNTIMRIFFSADGKHLLTASPGPMARADLWDVVSGDLVRRVEDFFAFDAEAARFAVDRGWGGVSVLGPEDMLSDDTLTMRGGPRHITDVAFVQGRERRDTTAEDGTVRLWDDPSATSLLVLPGRGEPVDELEVSDDGARLFAVVNGEAVVWDATTTRALPHLPSEPVRLPDGVDLGSEPEVPTGGGCGGAPALFAPPFPSGRTVLLLPTGAGPELQRHEAETTPDTARPRQPMGWFWIVPEKDSLRVVNAQTQRTVAALPITVGKEYESRGNRITADGKSLVMAEERRVRVWDLSTARMTASLPSQSSHDGGHVVGVSADGRRVLLIPAVPMPLPTPESPFPGRPGASSCELWDPLEPRRIATLEGVAYGFSDPAYVFTTSEDFVVRAYDTGVGTLRMRLALGRDDRAGQSIVGSPGRLVSIARQGTATIWDADSGRAVCVLADSAFEIADAVLSPSGRRIATSGRLNGGLRVWDAETGSLLTDLTRGDRADPAQAVRGYQWTPDGEKLRVTYGAGESWVWDMRLETRSPEDLARRVAGTVPWFLHGAQLVARETSSSEALLPAALRATSGAEIPAMRIEGGGPACGEDTPARGGELPGGRIAPPEATPASGPPPASSERIAAHVAALLAAPSGTRMEDYPPDLFVHSSAAQALAAGSRAVLLIFWSADATASHRQAAELLPMLTRLGTAVDVVCVDVSPGAGLSDDEKKLVRRYYLGYVPTTVVLSPERKPRLLVSSRVTAAAVEKALTEVGR